MATMNPGRSASLSRMTAGEKRFSLRVDENLENFDVVWLDVQVGPVRRIRPVGDLKAGDR